MSRWVAFFAGACGTFLWIAATAVIWTVQSRWETRHAGDIAFVATLLAWVFGVSVGLAIVSEIAKSRQSLKREGKAAKAKGNDTNHNEKAGKSSGCRG